MHMFAKKLMKSVLSMLLVLCLLFSMAPANVFAVEDTTEKATEDDGIITYVSIGDSMTNGYCLDGYDGTSGGVNYGIETYSNEFAAWLAGYTGAVVDDQVIFEGSKGTVDHRQLAVSGMRAQDLQWILNLDYTDAALMEAVYDCNWDENTWYNTWGFYGDRNTWSECCDNDYRYADVAARILYVYGQNGYFTSSYADQTAIDSAIAGIKANPYYPAGSADTAELGNYKILQIATEFYQKSIEDADIISMAVGNTNFGTHMLSNITDVLMDGDMSFSSDYNIDNVRAQNADNAFAIAKVDEMLSSAAYAEILEECVYLAGGNAEYEKEIAYIVEFCMTHFILGYIGMMDKTLELNPDAEIIQIALMNAYAGKDENGNPVINEDTLGDLVRTIYTPVNAFLKSLPEELLASKSEEEQAQYADAKFYFAEADQVSCMVDVFGDDFYTSEGGAITYPGLLTGNEGYEANTNSIVRSRFVEEIVCGNMIFAAMGLQKQNTQTNIQNFLLGGQVVNPDGSVAYDGVGAIEYDMMTATQKALYAAQNANAAKEYALYLAFENVLIRSGTQDITMDALAGLANIREAFLLFYPEVTAAIGAAQADYYKAVAPVIVLGSEGALTQEQILMMMDAYEQVKAGVWEAFAAYHEALAAATGHTSINHVIHCDTCKNNGGHGDGISEQIVATYNDQMEQLPYTIVAEVASDQTGGLLDGKDIKRLCEAEDYEAEVYAIISEKSAAYSGDQQTPMMTPEQVKTLAAEEEGVWIVADELTGGQYGPDMIKLAYENALLDETQTAQIEMLISVRESVLKLLAVDEAGNYTIRDTFVSSAAGIKSAIDNTALLAYLVALPQSMSDTLFGDTEMRGALCMNARCLLGTGAGGHPSVGGHDTLYASVFDAYIRKEAPTSVTAEMVKNGIMITWDAVEGADQYGIYRAAVNGQWELVDIVTGTQYADSSMEAGVEYAYAVRCMNAYGDIISEMSEEARGAFLNAPQVTLSNTKNGVKISWKKVEGATGYTIYRKLNGNKNFKEVKVITSGDTLNYTDGVPVSGKTYNYRVVANMGAYESAFTAKTILRLANTKSVTLTNTGDGVRVSWTKVTGAGGYKIYRKAGNGSYALLKTINNGNTISMVDTAAKNGTKYTYKVIAVKGNYQSGYVTKTTVRLTTPKISSLKNSAEKTILVKWNKNAKATGYEVRYVTGENTKMVTVKKNATVSQTIKKLTKGKTYKVSVRSYKTVNNVKYYSAWSTVKSVKVSK